MKNSKKIYFNNNNDLIKKFDHDVIQKENNSKKILNDFDDNDDFTNENLNFNKEINDKNFENINIKKINEKNFCLKDENFYNTKENGSALIEETLIKNDSMKKILKNKIFKIITYGCQMNVHTSDRLEKFLKENGMIHSNNSCECDVLIMNTCYIREKASHKVFAEIGRINKIKKSKEVFGKKFIIGVIGCVPQAENENFFKKTNAVDFILGTQQIHKIPEMLFEIFNRADDFLKKSFNLQKKISNEFSAIKNFENSELKNFLKNPNENENENQNEKNIFKSFFDLQFNENEKNDFRNVMQKIQKKKENFIPVQKLINIDFSHDDKFDFLPIQEVNQYSAFLAIQEGCDKFCSYCVVPFTRGREFSREPKKIIEEAKILAENGAIEITLLGQNVNGYECIDDFGKKISFVDLILKISEIDSIKRIFYTSSHPIDVKNELILAHAQISKLMPFIHLPIQSGSNRILKKMNRHHSVEKYLEIIDEFKKFNKKIAFASDFIVGFPSETEEDFEKTIDVVKKVNYARGFSFKYSRRKGTPADLYENQIPEEEKLRRLLILQNELDIAQKNFNEKTVQKILPVFFYKIGRKKMQIVGKTEYLQNVVLETNEPEKFLNKIVEVKIISSQFNTFFGENYF